MSVTPTEEEDGDTVYNFEVQDNHTYFVGSVDGGEWVHNDCTGGCPLEEPSDLDGVPDVLYHYTTEEGMNAIVDSESLNPSVRAVNPKDARYGDGQYLTDIAPGTKRPGQLSAAFVRRPWFGKRFTHYVAIKTDGLVVKQGRKGVFVVPNNGPLDLKGRIVGYGTN